MRGVGGLRQAEGQRVLDRPVGDALAVALRQHDGGVVADHAAALDLARRPARQVAQLIAHRGQAVGQLVGQRGPRQDHPRVQRPVGVPHRVVAVERPVLVQLQVHAHVAAVDVGVDRRHHPGVVQRGRELLLDLGAAPGDQHALEGVLPGVLGAAQRRGDAPPGQLGGEVGLCSVHADGAQRHLHLQRSVEVQVHAGLVGRGLVGLVAQLRGEVELQAVPSTGQAAPVVDEAGQGGAVDVQGHVPDLGVRGAGVSQVDHQPSVAGVPVVAV